MTGKLERHILLIRGQRVMLSTHLAELYAVKPKALVQAVKRNIARFPPDFMFQLSAQELANLKSQFVTSSWGGLRRANPYAFTQEGVAMLSGVLNSPRAVRVNIAIMRAFVHLREALAAHKDLPRHLAELERRVGGHDRQIHSLFEAIRQLMGPGGDSAPKIGFRPNG